MEFYQLRYFESVIRHGSLTTAAADCHVSQPSLSTQLKNLEAEFGLKLVERKPRGVVPTPAGERLLLTSRRLLAEVDSCQHDLRRRNFHSLPELRIGVAPLFAAVMLPRPLARFLHDMDSYRIIVRELPHQQLAEALTSHAIDLGLITQARPLPVSIEARTLFQLNYAIFCPRDHPLTRLRQPRLRDLLPYRLALYQDPAGFVDRLSQLGIETGKPPRIIFSSDQALTVFEMALAGLGVAVLPTLFKDRARRRRMVMLPLHDRNLGFPFVAAWSRDRSQPPGLEAFLRACQILQPAI
ncbi:MAG: LysR family transcriptional regulator [Opitutaceae bacterium]|nr:LysR family transcriptional regulator [Opitutaceae bacterium]